MAFEPGHGRTAVPVRSALVGTTVAVAAVVAAMVFGASFLGLVGTPHRYGQNWPQELNLQAGAVPWRHRREGPGAGQGTDRIRGRQLRGGQRRRARSGGAVVPAIGLDQLRGRGFLTLLAGRAPAGPREIVLGPRTLRTLGLHVGQRVKVDVNGRACPDARSWARRSSRPRVGGKTGPPIWAPARWSPPRCSPSRVPRAVLAGRPATTSSCCATGRVPTCGWRPPR